MKTVLHEAGPYAVVDKSNSGHCCFVASVMDTRDTPTAGGYTDAVCECYDVDQAKRIADALAATEPT